jgi:hypothetical protein
VNLLPRAWYGASTDHFLAASSTEIIGQLAASSAASGHAIEPAQTEAWESEIAILKSVVASKNGSIFLEFNIPRMGRRIDAVLLLGAIIFVVEFKVGSKGIDKAAINQAWDYGLDLKNFHEGSHQIHIVPIVVATETEVNAIPAPKFASDGVAEPLPASPSSLSATINEALRSLGSLVTDWDGWVESAYRPTPTIIEAALALYTHHSVEEIARHDAGADELQGTSRRIEELIADAKSNRKKVICFVTGVPGAGKTLVGLNVATLHRNNEAADPAVYLSGNGPLVLVLREALTRDELRRRKAKAERVTRTRLAEPVKAFIQNVHHFRDEALRSASPPFDHVVVFDEAQRAWDARKTALFMKQRKGQPNFTHSEAQFLLSYMDRHRDWAVVVCLVGGGQEIHTGEAGISAWLDAVQADFPHWHLHISSQLRDSEYDANSALQRLVSYRNAHLEPGLHLAVSMRSFRAEHVSGFVKAALDCDSERARDMFRQMADRYPIAITRDLLAAKKWLRVRARGTERYGMVASSKAMRLKPHAIDIRVSVDPIHWFLDGPEDTRSSWYLEDCATEFQTQGLELDWVCVNWDADLRFTGGGWTFHDFRGRQWQAIRNQANQNYLRNAYRVLLTRARQGMVLFIPPGDLSDPTRLPTFYERTFSYFVDLGIPALEACR